MRLTGLQELITTERDTILNELAQGLRPMSQGVEWFDAHDPDEQAETLLFLRHHCVQARASAVLITRGPIDMQLGKIADLTPVDERRKAFRPLVAVLSIADERRRERFCSGGCGHWWHHLAVADRG
ncbi:DUF5958 family protein [Streptomyces erythrochromogenes]